MTPEVPVNVESCSSSIGQSEYWGLSSNKVNRIIQTEMTFANHDTCISTRDIEVNDGSVEDIVSRAVNRVTAIQEVPEPVIPLEWENTAHFQNNWINQIYEHQSDLLPADKIATDKDLRTWFVYYFNEEDPKSSKYGCRLCTEYYDKFKLASNHKSSFSLPGGTLRTTKKKNTDQINEHPKTNGHFSVIEMLKEEQKNRLPKIMTTVQETEEQRHNEINKITANMMKTVYAEVRMNTPFQYHPFMVELLKLHGVNVGYHHYDKNGAQRMSAVISSEMHKTLLEALVKNNYPCSLIIDGSTSIGLYHYLTVLLQTLENERPVVYFYRLIDVGQDSSATGLMNVFESSLSKEKIDITAYLKRNLVGFGADGASVNLGRKGGFIVKLNEFVGGREIYSVWCMPHRLELAIKAALKANPGMYIVDEAITALTNFYNSRSYKRKAHLRNHAMAENLDLYELHFAFRERWIMSDYTAIRAVIKGWALFVSDLEQIQTEPEFQKDWDIAKGILKLIKSRTFVISLHFLFDLLEGLKKFSTIAQQSAGVLIGKEQFRLDLLEFIMELKESNGAHLTALLTNSICSEKHEALCTPEEFLESSDVRYKSIELLKDRKSSFLELRIVFQLSLFEEVQSYFPENTFKPFDIFVPKYLPQSVATAMTFGHYEIQTLADRFGLNPDIASKQWQDLLISMIQQDNYCTTLQYKAERFWPYYLKKTSLDWGRTIQRLIRIVLVLPANSADAERSFSIMNHIKYDRRSRLTSENLDHLMRLRINGPSQLDRFPSAKYARAWTKLGHMRTDDPNQQRKRKHHEIADDDEQEETKQIFMTSDLF